MTKTINLSLFGIFFLTCLGVYGCSDQQAQVSPPNAQTPLTTRALQSSANPTSPALATSLPLSSNSSPVPSPSAPAAESSPSTALATASADPSADPSAAPSATPSAEPTALVTAIPTTAPTVTPSITGAQIMTQKCAYCHSLHPASSSGYSSAPRGLALDTLQEVTNNLTNIKRYVQSGSMPIGGITLTFQERSQILNWLPSSNTTPSSASPTPTPTPPPIQALTAPEMIAAKCSYCHSRTPDPSSGYSRSPGGIAFDTTQEMQSRTGGIAETVSGGEMPPRRSGITLTSQEKQTILNWASQLGYSGGTGGESGGGEGDD